MKPPLINFAMNEQKIGRIVRKRAKDKGDIIYGRRAMNRQVPGFMQAETYDYDVYTNKPKQAAQQIQRQLDKEISAGHNSFYSKPALHPGTYKVRHVGRDLRKGTDDDYDIVDYTKKPKKVPVKSINQIKYESLSSIRGGKRKILRDKESQYRHHKDRDDIKRINFTQSMRTKRRTNRYLNQNTNVWR